MKGKGKSPQVTNVSSSSVNSSYNSYMEVTVDPGWIDDDMDPDYLAAIEASLLEQTNGIFFLQYTFSVALRPRQHVKYSFEFVGM